MKPIIFDSQTEAEFLAAINYYEGQRQNLGTEFEAEVERALAEIVENPQRFPSHGDDGLRKCQLRRFPYTIFYLDMEECIWIAAVAHQRRKPGYWAHRHPE